MKREETEKLTKWQQLVKELSDFRHFLYKKEGDEPAMVMGRTAMSWGKLGLFFLVYYACLAAFFAAMFAIAFTTMPDIKDGPKFRSFLTDRPLLTVYPDGVGSYKTDNDTIDRISRRYSGFLKAYEDSQCYLMRKCQPGDGYRPETEEKQCGFDLSSLGPCAPSQNAHFGYKDHAPCLYLRLSKLYGWKPEPYGSGKYVKLNCNGGDNAKIFYYPNYTAAFPISFWPFRGESAFRTPIAAIQVTGNKRTVTIKCQADAENIELSDTYDLEKGAYGRIEFTVAGQP